jgi:peptidyl-dipeptidase Dcp
MAQQQQIQHPLEFSNLKNHAVPFDKLAPSMYMPRLRQSIQDAKNQIEKIKTSKDKPTFENTILALEMAGEDIDLVSSVFYNQLGANTSDELQTLAKEIGPLLSNYSSDILLDDQIFQRIQAVYKESKNNLDVEENELLEKYYTNFTRNGALLTAQQKAELRALDEEASQLGPQFSENVLKATNEFKLILKDKAEVAGLPESSLEAAKMTAKEAGIEDAWVITLQAPSYLPFMQYCQHRPSREKLYLAFNSRAFGGTFDNLKNISRIVEIREKRAKLLGYKNHAEFVLEKRMAEKSEKVLQFLEKIKVASVNAAKADVARVQKHAIKNGGPETLMPWDFSFWSERLKEDEFQFNAEELRPYFKLENVIAGAFEHARLLYGIVFRKSEAYPVYHPDVSVYEAYDEDSNEFIGLFYTDFFPRESKNGGAWMTNYFEQGYFKGQIYRPHVAIVCNFTKPTTDKPSLLTFDEVSTVFHEFGHALHSLLSKCKYRSLSGTNVYWDFVELPSQIMENWVLEKESLDLFASHYETKEKIPAALAKKIKDSSKFLAGYMSLRQVTFALLDMAWHTTEHSQIKDYVQFENNILKDLQVLPKVDGINFSCGFSHIFAGGYSAGYYSYKWAEVLDADAFELFKEHGLFNKEVARNFKENILSRGGTEHPMKLYKKFRGREPDPNALFKREGFL